MQRSLRQPIVLGLLIGLLLPGLALGQPRQRRSGTAPRTRDVQQASPLRDPPGVYRGAPVYRVDLRDGVHLGRIEALNAAKTQITVALLPTGRKVVVNLRSADTVDLPDKSVKKASRLVGHYVQFEVRTKEFYRYYSDVEQTRVAELTQIHASDADPPLDDEVIAYLQQASSAGVKGVERAALDIAMRQPTLARQARLVVGREVHDVTKRAELFVQEVFLAHAVFLDPPVHEDDSPFTRIIEKTFARRDLQRTMATITFTLPEGPAEHIRMSFLDVDSETETDNFEKIGEFNRRFKLRTGLLPVRVPFRDAAATCHILPGAYRVLLLAPGYERCWFDLNVAANETRVVALPKPRRPTFAVVRQVAHNGISARSERATIDAYVSDRAAVPAADQPTGEQPRDEIWQHVSAGDWRLFRDDDGKLRLCGTSVDGQVADLGVGTLETFVDLQTHVPKWIEPSALYALSMRGTFNSQPPIDKPLRYVAIEEGHVYRFDGRTRLLVEIVKVTDQPDEAVHRLKEVARQQVKQLVLRKPEDMNDFLATAHLTECEQQLQQFIALHPADQQAQFALGATQFLLALEHLSQKFYRYGALNQRSDWLPGMFAIPLVVNPTPATATYADLRQALKDLLSELASAEATLAKVTDPKVKLRLDLLAANMDIRGDGISRWMSLPELQLDPGQQVRESFVVAFDYSDALWLRGYCHTLSAFCEAALIHDHQPYFDNLAFNPYEPPTMAVLEKERGKAVLDHVQAVVDLSRLTWKAIQAETDDDAEWLPGPRQKNGVLRVAITDEMVVAWHDLLNDLEALVAGKLLLPLNFSGARQGLNVRTFLLDPPALEWRQWQMAEFEEPYVEQGEVVTLENIWRLNEVFRGNLLPYALWIN